MLVGSTNAITTTTIVIAATTTTSTTTTTATTATITTSNTPTHTANIIATVGSHGEQGWWGPCVPSRRIFMVWVLPILLFTTLYNFKLLFTILYYYLLLYITLYNSRLFSTTLATTIITTAGGHGKQGWWGPCMPSRLIFMV